MITIYGCSISTARHDLGVERKSPLLPLQPDTLCDTAALASGVPPMANFAGGPHPNMRNDASTPVTGGGVDWSN